METNRRGFIGWIISVVVSLLGQNRVMAIPTKKKDTPVSFAWIKQQLTNSPSNRLWKSEDVDFSYVDCTGMRCYDRDEVDGFHVTIKAVKRGYFIVGKKNYLGGISYNFDSTDITRLTDGNRTVEAWHRIVHDIANMETFGTKYV